MSTLWPSSFDHRGEARIALGRVALALTTLLASLPDLRAPGPPREHVEAVLYVLGVYTLHAGLVGAWLWRCSPIRPRDHLVVHGIDLVFLAALTYLSPTAISPVAPFLVFFVVAAAIRWRRRGVVFTGAAALALVVGIGLVRSGGALADLDRFIVRGVCLVVVACTIGYVAAYERRPGAGDDRLVAWPWPAARSPADGLVQQTQAVAAADERMRLARDLHDGLLQTLTTLSFQLETAARGLDDEARVRIASIQERLGDEQRRLRLFTRELRSPAFLVADASGLGAQLRRLTGQLSRDWHVAVALSLEGAPGLDDLSGPIVPDLYFLVNEAVSNAVRHGAASRIQIDLAIADGHVRLSVIDDGRGFPFHGCYDDRELSARRWGPVSLRERVTGAGGHLTVDSQPSGARLRINLPIRTAVG